jgi:uncharacterized protein (TIGR00251 family)
MAWAEDTPDGCLLRVRVVPRASRTEIAGVAGEALRVRLQASPVDNKANEALRLFLAASLDLPRRQLRLVSGDHSRDKCLHIEGLSAADLARLL